MTLVTRCKPPDVQCREIVARLMTANLLDCPRFCFMPQNFADRRRLKFNAEMPAFAARACQQILHLGVHRGRVAHRKQPIKPLPVIRPTFILNKIIARPHPAITSLLPFPAGRMIGIA
jgi:hypothetical protein